MVMVNMVDSTPAYLQHIKTVFVDVLTHYNEHLTQRTIVPISTAPQSYYVAWKLT